MKKKGRIMHLLASFLFLSILLLGSLSSDAQNKVVNMNYKDASFVEVINAFRQQTGVKFLYNLEKVKNKRCKDLILKNVPVDKAIGIVLEHFGFTYSMVEGVVVVKELPREGTKIQTIKGKVADENGDPLPGVTVLIKGTHTGVATDVNGNFTLTLTEKKERILVFSFIGMQTKEVKCTGNEVLQVTMLADATQLDEVVVQMGYNSLPRKDMVGSYNTLKADDIMMQAYSSIDQMLQGRVPGMMVINTSSRVGRNPKITIRGTSTILGNTDPLWVVDGIIQPDPLPFNSSNALTSDLADLVGNQISWLNPADIETITVLKDASATAIYGSKASNGVIVITTKKGNAERTSIRYSANFSFRARPNYDMFDYMNSKERIQFSKEAYDAGARYANDPLPQIYTYEGLMRMFNERSITEEYFEERMAYLETVNTDWFDLLTRNSFSNNHNLSISGGSQKVTYNASFGYTSDHGVEIGNDMTRFSARLNVNVRLLKTLQVDFNINGSFGNNKGYGPGVNPIGYATTTSRALPAYENGKQAFYKRYQNYSWVDGQQELGFNIMNEIDNSYSKNKNSRFDVSVNANWDITPWLKYQFVGSIADNHANGESFAGEKTNYITAKYRGYEYGTEKNGSEKYKAAILPFGGEFLSNHNRTISYNMQHKLLFSKTFNEIHRVNAMAGLEIRSDENKSETNTVWGYVPERGEKIIRPNSYSYWTPIGMSKPTDSKILDYLYEGGWQTNNMTSNAMSYFATLAYSLMERYVLNANIRADASNRFGQDVNKQFDPMYSFGISWRIGEEEFIKDKTSWLNQMNIRATYGIQGNVVTSVSPDLIAKQDGVLNIYNEYILGISSLPNPLLKWENTKTWNLGIDLQLFKGITMNLEYYGRRSNAIISQDIPNEYGQKSMQLNGGRIDNHGIEYSINLTPFSRKDFAWTVGINASKNWNKSKTDDVTIKVDQISKNDFLSGGNGNRLLKKGYPLTAFWSYKFTGLSPETGYPTFDIGEFEEGDNTIDPTTFLVYSGQRQPYFTGGLNTRIRYKDFTLGADFVLLLGGKQRLTSPYSSFTNQGSKIPDPYDNLPKDLNKRWKKSGDEKHTNIPALFTSEDVNELNILLPDGEKASMYEMWASSDALVVSSSFLRCTQLSLNWNLNRAWCAKFGATSLSVNASVNNLFVIASKKFNGFDPELDRSIQPKIFSFGLSVGF